MISFHLDSPPSPGEFEKELDAMLAGMTVKESNHSPLPLLNNVVKTQGRYHRIGAHHSRVTCSSWSIFVCCAL